MQLMYNLLTILSGLVLFGVSLTIMKRDKNLRKAHAVKTDTIYDEYRSILRIIETYPVNGASSSVFFYLTSETVKSFHYKWRSLDFCETKRLSGLLAEAIFEKQRRIEKAQSHNTVTPIGSSLFHN